MRKSERLRLVELELVRLQMQMELMTTWLNNMVDEIDNQHRPDLEAGKWYNRNA
jgi:DNA topoisomerase IB